MRSLKIFAVAALLSCLALGPVMAQETMTDTMDPSVAADMVPAVDTAVSAPATDTTETKAAPQEEVTKKPVKAKKKAHKKAKKAHRKAHAKKG